MVRDALRRLTVVAYTSFIVLGIPAHALDSSEEYYEDANRLMSDQDYKAAIIQLKNAMQLDPEHVPSLVLAGEVYLKLQQPSAAEDELFKARVLGADRSFINLKLAEAYAGQGKYRELLDNLALKGLSSSDTVQLLGYYAEAYLALGMRDEAAETIARADKIDPLALRPNIARVILYLRTGQIPLALEAAQNIIAKYPFQAKAWNSYASALHGSGELDSALENYGKAIELDRDHVDARIARIGLMLDLGRDMDTQPDLDFLDVNYPYEPRAAYFRGLVASRAGDSETSFKELKKCSEVVALLPPRKVASDPQLTMVASLAYYGLGEFESAKEYLKLYLKRNSSDVGANRLLGNVLLQLKETSQAINILQPLLAANPNDTHLLSLMVSVYGQAGMHKKASNLLERLQLLGFGGVHTDTRLAMSRLESGATSQGIEGLHTVFVKDSTQVNAGFSLVAAYLKARDYTKAVESAEVLVRQAPDNLTFRNILGVAQYAAGKLDMAYETFNGVLRDAPTFLPASINLAKIEIAQNSIAEARKRLSGLLIENPENPVVLLAQARLERQQKALIEARKLAEKALRIKPSLFEIRLFLIELLLQLEELEAAEMLAREAVSLQGGSFESMSVLGQVLVKSGKPKEALVIYSRMVKEAGFKTTTLFKVARLQVDLKAYSNARHSLSKALKGNPFHGPSRILLVKVQLALGELEDALEGSRALINANPGEAVGYGLEGDSFIRLKRYSMALASYRRGLALGYDPVFIIGQYQVLLTQNKRRQAGQLLEKTWRQHSDDMLVGLAYAQHLMMLAQWQPAEKVLESLLPLMTNNPQVLNNMAYVLHRSEKEQALGFARQAYGLAQEDPLINDTLGWILVTSGKSEEGLKYLRQAVARSTDNPELRYHLAVALQKMGREVEAKSELQFALAGDRMYEGRKDAEALWEKLQ